MKQTPIIFFQHNNRFLRKNRYQYLRHIFLLNFHYFFVISKQPQRHSIDFSHSVMIIYYCYSLFYELKIYFRVNNTLENVFRVLLYRFIQLVLDEFVELTYILQSRTIILEFSSLQSHLKSRTFSVSNKHFLM